MNLNDLFENNKTHYQRTKILIDADFISYHSQNITSENEAKNRAEQKLQSIISNLCRIENLNHQDIEVELTFTGSSNIRYDVYAQYKANRKSKSRPEFSKQIIKHIKEIYRYHANPEYESDDIITELARKYSKAGYVGYVISQDKDVLYQCPCAAIPVRITKDHNQVIEILSKNTKADIVRNIAMQLFCGDPTDGIPGLIKGKGEKYFRDVLIPYFEKTNISIIHVVRYLIEMMIAKNALNQNEDYFTRLRLIFLGYTEFFDEFSTWTHINYGKVEYELSSYEQVFSEVIFSKSRTLSGVPKIEKDKRVSFEDRPVMKKGKYQNKNLNDLYDYEYFSYLYSSPYATVEQKRYIQNRMKEADYVFDPHNDKYTKIKGSLNQFITFGKYSGMQWKDVTDVKYCQWVISSNFRSDIQQCAVNRLLQLSK